MLFRVLAVGDVVGNPGLDFAAKNLKRIKKELGADFAVVNGENANVVGVTPRQCDAHTRGGRRRRHARQPHLDALGAPALPRRERSGAAPGQLRAPVPRQGLCRVPHALRARARREPAGQLHPRPQHRQPLPHRGRHARGAARLRWCSWTSTPRPPARSWPWATYLDGRVSAVWGTHTHVQTSDARILPRGTGFITDLGMTGPAESVIGIKPEQSIGKFLGDVPRRYDCAPGPAKLEGALFELDSETGACTARRGR